MASELALSLSCKPRVLDICLIGSDNAQAFCLNRCRNMAISGCHVHPQSRGRMPAAYLCLVVLLSLDLLVLQSKTKDPMQVV